MTKPGDRDFHNPKTIFTGSTFWVPVKTGPNRNFERKWIKIEMTNSELDQNLEPNSYVRE